MTSAVLAIAKRGWSNAEEADGALEHCFLSCSHNDASKTANADFLRRLTVDVSESCFGFRVGEMKWREKHNQQT